MTNINNRYIEETQLQNEEYLKDILFVDGNEANFGNYENKNALMERVWWLSKPPIVKEQIPAVSARLIQVTKERLSSMIKKPRGLTETLRDKIEENLKKQSRHTRESQNNVCE